MNKKVINLVCWPTWMEEELQQTQNFEIKHSYGLEIPEYVENEGFWIPQEPATHFMLSGMQFNFQAPSGNWLPNIPTNLTKRVTETYTVEEILNNISVLASRIIKDNNTTLFWKLAEAKHELFTAKPRNMQELKNDIQTHNLPNRTILQVSEIIQIDNEYRVFMLHGKPTTCSLYVNNITGTTYYDGAEAESGKTQQVIDWVKENPVKGPDGYTLDIGENKEGFFILEANPAWCSAWYGCDINYVAETIHTSTTLINHQWDYTPDQSMIERLAKKAKLPHTKK